MLGLLAALSFGQVDMTPFLERGPLVLVEESKGGKFGQCSAIVIVDAPPDAVWKVLLKMDDFKTFVPKVIVSEIIRTGEKDKDYDVHFVIDVPGPDTDYKVRYTPDHVKHIVVGTWLSGDLKGSHWEWRVDPAPGGKSLLTHTATLKNFSSFAQSFDDDQQTVTTGVNVSSVLAGAKAVKHQAEKAPIEAAAAVKP